MSIQSTRDSFKFKAARRIAIGSFFFAIASAGIAFFAEMEQAEKAFVAMASEETRRVASETATPADWAKALRGGLFDIAEIYDANGKSIAEAMTPAGRAVEAALPMHVVKMSNEPSYESIHLDAKKWVLRITVPMAESSNYFEGVRVIPPWQENQIFIQAAFAALVCALCALGCGAIVYPLVSRLADDNAHKTELLLQSHLGMLDSLGRAISKRDSDTGNHNYRVAYLAAQIGRMAKLPNANMRSLVVGSFLHDVGKIGIPDAILLKPGKLDAREFETMKTHVGLGEDIVAGYGWLQGASQVVAGHHEKWDGSGYPRGIAGSEIPIEARVFAIADVFDALCSKRPYKDPMDLAAAMAIIHEGLGKHFDPVLGKLFSKHVSKLYARLYGPAKEDPRELMSVLVVKIFSE